MPTTTKAPPTKPNTKNRFGFNGKEVDTFIADNLVSILSVPDGVLKKTRAFTDLFAEVIDISRTEYLQKKSGFSYDGVVKGRGKDVSDAFNAVMEAVLIDSAIPVIVKVDDTKEFWQTALNIMAFMAVKVPPGANQVKFLNRVNDVIFTTTGIRTPKAEMLSRVEKNMDKVFDSVFQNATTALNVFLGMELEAPKLSNVDPLSAKPKPKQSPQKQKSTAKPEKASKSSDAKGAAASQNETEPGIFNNIVNFIRPGGSSRE